jgi:hypothetical protein
MENKIKIKVPATRSGKISLRALLRLDDTDPYRVNDNKVVISRTNPILINTIHPEVHIVHPVNRPKPVYFTGDRIRRLKADVTHPENGIVYRLDWFVFDASKKFRYIIDEETNENSFFHIGHIGSETIFDSPELPEYLANYKKPTIKAILSIGGKIARYMDGKPIEDNMSIIIKLRPSIEIISHPRNEVIEVYEGETIPELVAEVNNIKNRRNYQVEWGLFDSNEDIHAIVHISNDCKIGSGGIAQISNYNINSSNADTPIIYVLKAILIEKSKMGYARVIDDSERVIDYDVDRSVRDSRKIKIKKMPKIEIPHLEKTEFYAGEVVPVTAKLTNYDKSIRNSISIELFESNESDKPIRDYSHAAIPTLQINSEVAVGFNLEIPKKIREGNFVIKARVVEENNYLFIKERVEGEDCTLFAGVPISVKNPESIIESFKVNDEEVGDEEIKITKGDPIPVGINLREDRPDLQFKLEFDDSNDEKWVELPANSRHNINVQKSTSDLELGQHRIHLNLKYGGLDEPVNRVALINIEEDQMAGVDKLEEIMDNFSEIKEDLDKLGRRKLFSGEQLEAISERANRINLFIGFYSDVAEVVRLNTDERERRARHMLTAANPRNGIMPWWEKEPQFWNQIIQGNSNTVVEGMIRNGERTIPRFRSIVKEFRELESSQVKSRIEGSDNITEFHDAITEYLRKDNAN